ncbi:MAG: GcvT family protein [Rhodobacteraceae bacterium]|nr:GcvT family protein [Paracoccaceae bacterium]TVR47520.1 MAG: FAD-dependent oxidoreductase [Paracoccaceae bacterium]
MSALPVSARVVIIGGGVSGCSVAWHLAELGWRDVVLLERKQLTSGTTWHAAGLVGQLRGSQNMTRLAKYSADLYPRLEAETGLATGFRQTGSITVALTPDRLEEIRRSAGVARVHGVEVEELSPAAVKERYPHLDTHDVKGGVWLPGDGTADPTNVTLALAKGARDRGVRIVEGVKVTGVTTAGGRVTGVDWTQGEDHGHIAAEMVVNCAGMWGRDLARASGVTLPLHACEHFYIVTEGIPGLGQLPVLRVPDECTYYKEDAGKLLVGAFEPKAKPWGMEGIPDGFCFDQLPDDFDHFEPILESAIARMPMLAEAGIHTFFNGPESFTPDDRYYLGEAPELGGYWVAAGYNSVGIASSGGAGMALAQWMNDGEPPFDLWEVDIRRAHPFQRNRRYLRERVSETLGLLYADHWPNRQPATARGIRRSPVHDRLLAAGAVFGEAAGWERANWFARPGQTAEYRYDWGGQNWFDNHRAEHMALREGVGLLDLSSFGKIRVEGREALAFLDRLCANRIDVAQGRIVYTQMLNARGGIECDLTVTRLSETAFLLVVPAATLQRDLAWLRRHLGDAHAVITDVTPAEAVFAVMGPNARDLLADCTPDDLSNAAFPFGRAREIELGMGLARAHRITYVGELGWELYVSADMAAHVFDTLTDAGKAHGLTLCGLHAMNSCRLEKGFRHFGHDITDEDHVLEAGLGFAVKTDKGAFMGHEAVLRRQDTGLSRRLMQFRLTDPNRHLHHNEPILRDGEIAGYITSGAYGHALGASIGLGYVPCREPGESAEEMLASSYHIEIAGQRIAATPSLRPLYDPDARRPRL